MYGPFLLFLCSFLSFELVLFLHPTIFSPTFMYTAVLSAVATTYAQRFLFRILFFSFCIPCIAVIFLTNHSVPPTHWYEFEPWGGLILLSLSQANNFQAWSRNQAVVVRLGLAVADPNLVEGATVILQGSSCTAVVCLFVSCGFFCPSEWSWRQKLCVVLFLDVTL